MVFGEEVFDHCQRLLASGFSMKVWCPSFGEGGGEGRFRCVFFVLLVFVFCFFLRGVLQFLVVGVLLFNQAETFLRMATTLWLCLQHVRKTKEQKGLPLFIGGTMQD